MWQSPGANFGYRPGILDRVLQGLGTVMKIGDFAQGFMKDRRQEQEHQEDRATKKALTPLTTMRALFPGEETQVSPEAGAAIEKAIPNLKLPRVTEEGNAQQLGGIMKRVAWATPTKAGSLTVPGSPEDVRNKGIYAQVQGNLPAVGGYRALPKPQPASIDQWLIQNMGGGNEDALGKYLAIKHPGVKERVEETGRHNRAMEGWRQQEVEIKEKRLQQTGQEVDVLDVQGNPTGVTAKRGSIRAQKQTPEAQAWQAAWAKEQQENPNASMADFYPRWLQGKAKAQGKTAPEDKALADARKQAAAELSKGFGFKYKTPEEQEALITERMGKIQGGQGGSKAEKPQAVTPEVLAGRQSSYQASLKRLQAMPEGPQKETAARELEGWRQRNLGK